MQEVKSFFQGYKDKGEIHVDSIEDQINSFLTKNPNYVARSISTVLNTTYLEAFVLFDIRDDKKPQFDKKPVKDKPTNGK